VFAQSNQSDAAEDYDRLMKLIGAAHFVLPGEGAWTKLIPKARARYSCFDHFGEDLQAYGYATSSRA
jgi:hypothetical protein